MSYERCNEDRLHGVKRMKRLSIILVLILGFFSINGFAASTSQSCAIVFTNIDNTWGGYGSLIQAEYPNSNQNIELIYNGNNAPSLKGKNLIIKCPKSGKQVVISAVFFPKPGTAAADSQNAFCSKPKSILPGVPATYDLTTNGFPGNPACPK